MDLALPPAKLYLGNLMVRGIDSVWIPAPNSCLSAG